MIPGLIRSIKLTGRKFTPVENAVLESVVGALPENSSIVFSQQVDLITKVVRYLDWTEILFYRIRRRKIDWSDVPLFNEKTEFTLSETAFNIDKQQFKSRIICLDGHIFSLVTRPGVKEFCFGTASNLQTKIITDPENSDSPQPHWLPPSYMQWLAKPRGDVNGWAVLGIEEIYTVALADADYHVLATRNGDEFLMSRSERTEHSFYYASTDIDVREVGDSFAKALRQT